MVQQQSLQLQSGAKSIHLWITTVIICDNVHAL